MGTALGGAAVPRRGVEAGQAWLRLCVFVLLSRFMAPCYCIAALFGKVVTLSSLETVTFLHFKIFSIAKEKICS